MKKCKYCGIEIRKIFGNYCNYKCENKQFEKEKKAAYDKLYKKLYKKYVYKEEETFDIKEKYISLEYFDDPKELLLKLINDWRNIQNERLEIINLETWQYSGYFEEQCTPWEAEIIYYFRKEERK